MGCTNGWGGPLSDDWIDEHAELGGRILERQRSLGMRPVLPGFAGHVPDELADADAREVEWQGFRTTVLQPGTDRFHEVATAYLGEQIRRYGTDHLYAVDPFIEMVPPTGDRGYLRDLAASIYEGMAAVDPRAVWVLQGWPFHYHRDFWTPQRMRAFLDGIPTDRVLIVDDVLATGGTVVGVVLLRVTG
jgi:alpha-N-acetylglucosaminidase